MGDVKADEKSGTVKPKRKTVNNLPKEHLPTQGRKPLSEETITAQQLEFCRRYALHGNGSRAAREAGFHVQYCSWALNQPVLVRKIQQFQQVRAKRYEVSADKIIAELARVAYSNLGDYLEVGKDGIPRINCDEIGRDELAALSQIEQDTYYEQNSSDPEDQTPVKRTKIKLHDKLRALQMLGQHVKLFDGLGDTGDDDAKTKAQRINNYLKKMHEADGDAT